MNLCSSLTLCLLVCKSNANIPRSNALLSYYYCLYYCTHVTLKCVAGEFLWNVYSHHRRYHGYQLSSKHYFILCLISVKDWSSNFTVNFLIRKYSLHDNITAISFIHVPEKYFATAHIEVASSNFKLETKNCNGYINIFIWKRKCRMFCNMYNI